MKAGHFRQIVAALAVFSTGALLLAFGIVRGEVDVVLQKAIRICLECIGIG